MTINRPNSVLLLMLALLTACGLNEPRRFTSLDASETGIEFRNDLKQSPDLNIFNYLYFYDGGGVAAGDLNGDGQPDLFFTANQQRNRLYLNEGDLRFRDVTDTAIGQVQNDWSTGVSMVDINADGRLDIYVCNVGSYLKIRGENKLYINQGNNEEGIPQFEEQGKAYGLDLVGFSTQAAFLDYDRDGDLDLYMLNHSVHSNGTFNYASVRNEYHPLAGDRLMRNDGGRFTDMTDSAGIYNGAVGYGLGVGISDFNDDNWPDIYVGNDFHEDDYLYLNNRDGTFREVLGKSIRHTSRSSMGNDLVDVNNDGYIDIFSLDMLPDRYEMLKSSAAEDPREIYESKLRYGYKHQFSRNTLQMNRGDGRFSEVGMLAGVHATGWSWAGLGADFDHNGYTDLFVSNGIKGRTNDLDYIKFISNDNIQYRLSGEISEEELALTDRMPEEKIHNYLFANTGGIRFRDVSKAWGLGAPTFSNGAVYADLDGDGDLDIVTNNVDSEATVYRNNSREDFNASSYLKLRFRGPPGNPLGVGVKVVISRADSNRLVRELYPVRGYQSSVPYTLHFGLDSLRTVAHMWVRWPDGREQQLRNIAVNQTLVVNHADEDSSGVRAGLLPPAPGYADSLFIDITSRTGISYRHKENGFVEFNREPLIPHMVSTAGPAVAVGDINGDGRDDFFVGGAKRQPSALYLQRNDGRFEPVSQPALQNDFVQEDVDALFEDFDGDGDEDLFVVSGGNEYYGNSEYMWPRLYLNEGDGNFVRDRQAVPPLDITGSVVRAADLDMDGDQDLFVGARSVPWNYGARPRSHLLINEGGSFRKSEGGLAKVLSDVGMVTDAAWADMDGDRRPDLVVAAEWEPLKIIYVRPGGGEVHTIAGSSGLWNCIAVADIDGDRRPDILAGNLGLNSKYKASPKAPLRMYVGDFDDNGKQEQLVTVIDNQGREQLFATRDELEKQLTYFGDRFPDYRSFAEASLHEVVARSKLEKAERYEVTELQSVVVYNREGGFEMQPMPLPVQFAPVHALMTLPGERRWIAAGNFFDANIQRGRYDASYGAVLQAEQDGALRAIPNRAANWFLDGQIRSVLPIVINGAPSFIVARNNAPLQLYRVNDSWQEPGTVTGRQP